MPGRDFEADRQAIRELTRRANCLHANAYKVDSSVMPDLIWRCWCPECETDLPAGFRFPCCGAEPGDGTGPARHAYNCAGLAPPPLAGPRPQQAVPHLPPRRPRKAAAALAPALAIAILAAVLGGSLYAGHARPRAPYHRNPADRAACYAYQQAISTDMGADWVNAIADGMTATPPLGDEIVAAQQRYGPQNPPIDWCNAHGYPVSLP